MSIRRNITVTLVLLSTETFSKSAEKLSSLDTVSQVNLLKIDTF